MATIEKINESLAKPDDVNPRIYLTLMVLYGMANLVPNMAILSNMDYFIYKYKVFKLFIGCF